MYFIQSVFLHYLLIRANKLLALRVFDSTDGSRWSQSVQDRNYEILCLSQFTLYATVKGTKPDFHKSMKAEDSKPMFENLVSRLSTLAPSRIQSKFIEKEEEEKQTNKLFNFTLFTIYIYLSFVFVILFHFTLLFNLSVAEGCFGAYSLIDIQNEGPVTIVLDSIKESEKMK